jgi:hypothetical protein
VDYTTLSKLAGDLVRLFWTDIERHHLGIDSINLTPEIAAGWRQRISYRPAAAAAPGSSPAEELVPRVGGRSVMMTVRAFYLDIAHAVSQHRTDSAALLEEARSTPPSDTFTSGGQTLRRLPASYAYTGRIWASATEGGPRTDLTRQESEAFWAWVFVEVLRHTSRFEELRELSHHSITQYRLPPRPTVTSSRSP